MTDMYARFLELVQRESAREQVDSRKRFMGMVFFCVIAPILMTGCLGLLARLHWIEFRTRGFAEFFSILAPLLYLAYIRFVDWKQRKGSIPGARKLKGDLLRSFEQTQWRGKMVQMMRKELGLTPVLAREIRFHFLQDLAALKFRMGIMTVLGGTVLYMLNQGFDFLTFNEGELWGEASSSIISSILFLLLLYSSALQHWWASARFEPCLDWIAQQQSDVAGAE